MKKKIAFLIRNLHQGGVNRYLTELISHLSKIESPFEIIIIHNEERYCNSFAGIRDIYINERSKIKFDYFASYHVIKREKIDLVVYPKLIIPLNHFFLKCRKINIIHDLGYFEKSMKLYPFADSLFMRIFLKPSCKIADKTITVSNFSRSDALNKLGLDENKIVAIYEGVDKSFMDPLDSQFEKTVIEKYELDRPYLFFSGSINPRKNLLRTLDAFALIKESIPHNIYITGINPWSSKEFVAHIKKTKLQGRIKILGYISDDELKVLYRNAAAFLYVSLYEGFGLPIIEAQASGCPVITSNVTSCPEIAGDSALIVSPYSVEEISAGILRIVNDGVLRESLIAKGYKNAGFFNWDKTAHLVKDVFEKIV